MRQPTHGSTRAALVLRRCAPRLGNHTGQWTLPGGRIDIWAAQRFWPAAWSPLPMYVAASLVWLGMALSLALWLALWLARHGRTAYGRLWTGWLLLWPALATLALAHWRVALLDPPAPVRDFNLLAVAMLSLAEVVQGRALLLQLAGDLPWVRLLRR